ncbi:MAG TPA: YIP1 family protein [Candidatus Avacidaminococcus intestinavium]|uniref:YIP1 family protein n=1 Tax=Candidatus Avacidaminococcus intestinavium TaxID=2840684 RepID=A0A9D1MPB9_9FIRM|nr:YIP1 family protein [Candidatus Avacidaminococcus intestinavium]
MRRKVFDLLFEPKQRMTELSDVSSLWRSLFYFVLSMGICSGIVTNVLFSGSSLAVRGGILLGFVVFHLVALIVYTCFLHGLSDACGAPGGDIRALLGLLGYAALPYLVVAPIFLLSVKLGGFWLVFIVLAGMGASLWALFLVIRALQAVYLLTFFRACAMVCFSIFLLTVATILPIYLASKMLLISFG